MTTLCEVDGCNNGILAKKLCVKHYKQMNRYGKILSRTIYDENKIIKYADYADYAEMELYDKNGEIIATTLIDLEDVESVGLHKWYLTDNGYVRCRKLNTYLHRFVMNPELEDVDHIYHNKLDNRKKNLRECLHLQNNRNTSKSNSNTGIKGVYLHSKHNKYYSSVNSEGVKHNSAFYEDISDAIRCRDIMELYLHKEYSSRYDYLVVKYEDISHEEFKDVVSSSSKYDMNRGNK